MGQYGTISPNKYENYLEKNAVMAEDSLGLGRDQIVDYKNLDYDGMVAHQHYAQDKMNDVRRKMSLSNNQYYF